MSELWAIVSLLGGWFSTAGGVKTNLLFFTRGRPTEIWQLRDLSGAQVRRR